ncbi:MAG: fibronectin type III domain-containing protein, partial [Bacteroidales bacterium]|nr:fibronectin type III domain-containing protein [Bacteroidales bacterium]
PLTGANRPQNGTVYADNSTIGTSAFVTTGKYNIFYNRNYFQKGSVENLESSTTFYLYAFPYIEGCGGGPIYNVANAPMISFRTNYKEPASLTANNVTSTRAELQVAIDAKAGHYLLAFDTLQLDQNTDMKIDETKTYAAGDKITFGTRQLTILDPCASNATYTLTNLRQGKEYYYYAWSVNAEQDWYSRLVARCGVAPVRKLPATINFNAAAPVNLKLENGPLPAGWEEGKNNTYEYALREVLNRKVLSVQSTGYGVPNPSDPSKLDIALARSVILSPYVNRGTSENVKATIEFVFWALNGNELITSRPKATDVLFVECENADGTWTEIGRVKSTASVSGGVHSLVIPNFMPKETFRFRFTLESTTELPDLTNPDNLTVYYAGISNILVESLSAPEPAACEAAVDLEVVEGSLKGDGVTLIWGDENEIDPVEYYVLYKEDAEEEWTVKPTIQAQLKLTGLQAGGSYTAKVRTYCTYEDSSELSTPVTFTTLSCAEPASVSATHIMSTSADLSWSGNGQSYAVIYATRRGDIKIDTLYTQETSVSLTDLIPDMAYSVYVISYCGEGHTSPSEPSEMEYFNTQVVCTAPRIEVVEGSVTWQSVAIAIFDAPSPDGEIYIRSKDTVDYKLEYLMDIKGRDVVKPFGFIDVENITYIVMARSFCEVDTSDWSEIVEFTTLPAPDCGAPSNLQASVDESGRSATVSWTAGENNQSWLLMRKEKDAERYDSIPNVRDTSATFYGLKPNTIYMWRIQASCDRFLYSTLVYGKEFTHIT